MCAASRTTAFSSPPRLPRLRAGARFRLDSTTRALTLVPPRCSGRLVGVVVAAVEVVVREPCWWHAHFAADVGDGRVEVVDRLHAVGLAKVRFGWGCQCTVGRRLDRGRRACLSGSRVGHVAIAMQHVRTCHGAWAPAHRATPRTSAPGPAAARQARQARVHGCWLLGASRALAHVHRRAVPRPRNGLSCKRPWPS